ncbi:type III secretion system export apparatus subunit SctU [Paraburkholderia agricolaris]|uniref:type III secretion system export apparatus subunit SctU n=1 Tax=Paraburkholderia agricolaris TaxID=2152888 RepID=UPI00129182DA|nr:type III secretion system export apparatus subunit SctU [Paraburkholderia agricolaris]
MSEKTEQPTSKRLRDAREEGQVAHSKDFSQAVLILAYLIYLTTNGSGMADHMAKLMLAPAEVINLPLPIALDSLGKTLLDEGIALMLPFILIPVLLGMAVEIAQVGFTLSFKALVPSGKRLNVAENATNIISKKSVVELLKSAIKIAVLSCIVWLVISHNLRYLVWLPSLTVSGGAAVFTSMVTTLTLALAPVYIALAGADVVWQRRQHNKQLMMSREEVDREYKEAEGDQQIKGRRKELHRELASNEDVQRSASASALVVNPTHVAVALFYDEARTALPLVWARGRDGHAQQMIGAARAAGVPVLRDVNLAWSLYEHGEKNQYIPSDLIGPVAEIIRIVNEMKQEGTL